MSYIGKQPRKAALTSSDIEDGIITAAKIEDGAVVAAEIASNAVTTAKINADAVTAAKIADDVINSEHIAADSIDAEHYAAGSVDTTALGADAVTGAKIADDAINSEHYTDGSIDTAHIADANVTTAKVADDAITAAKINNDIISGTTALAAEPADTDEFLVSDAGTLKRIDYSLIKSGTPHMVKISTQTASGDSTLDFTSGIDSTYQQYHFEFTEINLATDGAEFQFQTDVGTDTSYNVGMTTIVYHAESPQGGGNGSFTYSNARDQHQGTAFQDLFPDAGNGSDEGAFGFLRVQNPSSSTYTKNFMSRMDGHHQNDLAFSMTVGGFINTTYALTRFRFKSSSGNFDGRITMYGVNA